MRFKNGDEFVFNREASARGRYKFNDKPMPGVTTILNEQSKQYLIVWAASEAYKHVLALLDGSLTLEALKNLVAQIIKDKNWAHKKKGDDAKEIGTDAHDLVEKFVKNYIATKTYEQPDYSNSSPESKVSVQRFVDWAIKKNVEFIQSEVSVCNPKYWYAGSFDFICKIDGKYYLGDFKTSKQIDGTYFAQGAAYIKGVEWIQEIQDEVKIKFDGIIIVKSVKQEGDIEYFEKLSNGTFGKVVIPAFEVALTEDIEKHWGYFLAMLYAYNYNKDYEVTQFELTCDTTKDWGEVFPVDAARI